ncbi:hypothetical protein DL96DRAFT_1682827 [Flagelloscypha sp. PMI_526]|nr:hypothetical protein DL96DRAFT_1682827 [Flagelloscypha sp. PMI_526]
MKRIHEDRLQEKFFIHQAEALVDSLLVKARTLAWRRSIQEEVQASIIVVGQIQGKALSIGGDHTYLAELNGNFIFTAFEDQINDLIAETIVSSWENGSAFDFQFSTACAASDEFSLSLSQPVNEWSGFKLRCNTESYRDSSTSLTSELRRNEKLNNPGSVKGCPLMPVPHDVTMFAGISMRGFLTTNVKTEGAQELVAVSPKGQGVSPHLLCLLA